MSAYERALAEVVLRGHNKGDRTGVGTRSLFGLQMRFDLAEGFPLITTKQVFMRPMIEELLWMLRGSTDNRELVERNVHIWDAWADPNTGDLGPIYGAQWRSWPAVKRYPGGEVYDVSGIDQISGVINSLRKDPNSRRHVVSAWNVAELPEMALAPCHCLFQFYVADGKLSCQLYQRSADMFLGVPFNIASYALLTHMIAQQCALGVGEFIWTGGDCHIYNNHHAQVALQLSRGEFPFPRLRLKLAESIFDYKLEDVQFDDYMHHPAVKAPVAV